jgi:DNA-binding NarL/FixJ family response regulator
MEVKSPGLSVLIIEDSLIIVKRLRAMLADIEGVGNMAYANDSSEGLMLASQLKPDVIFLDIKIPGKSGVDILPEIRLNNSATIIVLTNYSDSYYKNLCLSLGAEFFLDKTNEFEKIQGILGEIYHKN